MLDTHGPAPPARATAKDVELCWPSFVAAVDLLCEERPVVPVVALRQSRHRLELVIAGWDSPKFGIRLGAKVLYMFSSLQRTSYRAMGYSKATEIDALRSEIARLQARRAAERQAAAVSFGIPTIARGQKGERPRVTRGD